MNRQQRREMLEITKKRSSTKIAKSSNDNPFVERKGKYLKQPENNYFQST